MDSLMRVKILVPKDVTITGDFASDVIGKALAIMERAPAHRGGSAPLMVMELHKFVNDLAPPEMTSSLADGGIDLSNFDDQPDGPDTAHGFLPGVPGDEERTCDYFTSLLGELDDDITDNEARLAHLEDDEAAWQ